MCLQLLVFSPLESCFTVPSKFKQSKWKSLQFSFIVLSYQRISYLYIFKLLINLLHKANLTPQTSYRIKSLNNYQELEKIRSQWSVDNYILIDLCLPLISNSSADTIRSIRVSSSWFQFKCPRLSKCSRIVFFQRGILNF